MRLVILIKALGDRMTVDVTETISQTVHPAFQLVRQHHVEALDILVSEYKHNVTGAIHYHLATNHDENVFLVEIGRASCRERVLDLV